MNIGDRIKIKGNWYKGQFTLLDGTTSDFDLLDGTPGTIIRENITSTYEAWIVSFDIEPGRFVEADKKFCLPLDDPFEIKLGKPKVCICSLNNLMVEGCTCGHIERYQPPHLREKSNAKV